MALGYATQQYLLNKYGQKHFQDKFAPKFPAVSTIGVLGIVFIAMALKAKAVADAPQLLLNIMIPVLLIYIANYLISTMIGCLSLDEGILWYFIVHSIVTWKFRFLDLDKRKVYY